MNAYYPSDDYPAIILENGSSSCRAGFAGQDAPMSAFPNMVGRKRCLRGGTSQSGIEDTSIGYDAQDNRELLCLTHPVQHGIVHNWDDMEKVLNYAFFSELQASPEQHPVLTTDLPLNSVGNQEKMAEMMFETYKTPAFFNAYEPALVLYSTGKCDGIVLNCGDGVTYTSPIIGGNLAAPANRLDFGGGDLTSCLQHLLYQRQGLSFTTASELDILREVKEELCYVRTGKSSAENEGGQSFKLPDGTHVTLVSERHECSEILFSPDGKFNHGASVQSLVTETLDECCPDQKEVLRSNIILAGGTTLLPNFAARLEEEVAKVSPKAESVYVSASPERKYHVWIGASIMASLCTFNHMWITRQDYAEFGPSVLHRKSLK